MSTKREIQAQVREMATALRKKADLLDEKASAIEGLPAESFLQMLGDQFLGPAYFSQLSAEVKELFMPSNAGTFDRALREYFAAAQREVAVKQAGER